MAELLLRQPLFKGSDYLDQLRRIIGFLGRPTESELDFIASSRARAFVRTLDGRVRSRGACLARLTIAPASLGSLDARIPCMPLRRLLWPECTLTPGLPT